MTSTRARSSQPAAAAELPAGDVGPGRRRPPLGRVARLTGLYALTGLPGFAVFGYLFWPIVDPRYMGWLFSPNALTFDAAASGMGWLHYSTDGWHWPLGANPRYGGNIADSLLFSDSIPSFAAPMKLLFHLSGAGGSTQILGLSILTCLVLQSSLGFALVRSCGGSRVVALLGSVFFVISPALLQRWSIASLFWQWLVLAGMQIALSSLRRWRRTGWWCAMIVVATGITPYIALMLVVMGTLDHVLRGRAPGAWRWVVLGVGAMALSTIASLYMWGAFSIALASAGTGSAIGEYVASNLGFVDSNGWSWFFRDLPGGTGEGFAYVGLGILALLLVALAAARWPAPAGRRWPSWPVGVWVLVISSALLSFLSVVPHFEIGSWTWDLPLPADLSETLGVFRANGRFNWVGMYCVMLAAIVLGARAWPRLGAVLVGLALVLQIADLQVAVRIVHGQVREATSQLPRFQDILVPAFSASGVRAVEVVPAYPYPPEVPWREIGLAQHEAGLPVTTVAYFNRYDSSRLSQIRNAGVERVARDDLRSDTVYVVAADLYDSYLRQSTDVRVLGRVDAWVVLRSTKP